MYHDNVTQYGIAIGILLIIYSFYKRKLLLLILSMVLLLWTTSLEFLHWKYDDIKNCGHDHLFVLTNNKIGVLNKWAKVVVPIKYEKAECCYKNLCESPDHSFWGDLDFPDDNFVCILQKNNKFYVLDKNEKLQQAYVIRKRIAEVPNLDRSISSNELWNKKINDNNILAFMIDDKEKKKYSYNCSLNPYKYTFISKRGIVIGKGQEYIVASGYEDNILLLHDYKWKCFDISLDGSIANCNSIMSSDIKEFIEHSEILSSCFENESYNNKYILTSSIDSEEKQQKMYTTKQKRKQINEPNSKDTNLTICPFCMNNGNYCGYCFSEGYVTQESASRAYHVINGESVNDLYNYPSSRNSQHPQLSGSQLCNSCGGKTTCPICHGMGETSYYGSTSRPCEYCKSTGDCPECYGTGLVPN